MRLLDEFFEKVDSIVGELDIRPDEECWYRGHSSSRFKLIPSLMRPKASGEERTKAEIVSDESDLYWEFRTRGISLNISASSGWDILFHMRHHSVATRLLDWTDTLGNALYFALRGYDSRASEIPCIWMLNGYALNEISNIYGEPFRELIAPQYLLNSKYVVFDAYSDAMSSGEQLRIEWPLPVAIYPEHKNSRLHAQRGYFTIHGTDIRPLEDLVPEKILRKIELPRALVDPAKKFLERAGINEYLMFPDPDGLARYLNSVYGYDV